MITGVRMTEKAYRKVDALSQSMIKEFYDDRKKFYKKYILGEAVEQEITQGIKMGNLVDCLYLTPELFEDKFFMSICADVPTEKMLAFCKALAKHSMEGIDDEGIQRQSFGQICELAYTDSGFKWTLARIMEQFSGKEPENYFQELMQTYGSGKIVITGEDVENANRIITALRTGQFTSFLNIDSTPEREIFRQVPIDGFVIEGRPFKGLLDMLEVNHAERYLQPYDLKVVWSVEGFYREYYLKMKAYLQAATYDLACAHLRETQYGGYEGGYEIRPMKFIVCDSINYYSPLIYNLELADIVDGFKGFTHRGQYYKGLIQLVKELNWHMDNNTWGMSMENYLNGGLVQVNALKQP